jgi:hypothetical protein
MLLIQNSINKLEEIKELLSQFSSELYTKPNVLLSEATVGQHFRHILEFYICLKKGSNTGSICYDERARNLLIETHLDFAAETISEILTFLNSVSKDFPLVLKANYGMLEIERTLIPSSLYRELAYALDHTIHHLAMIKIGLSNEDIKFDENFGVAPSTLRFREKCAQ